jgi:succinate dehydrogenase / fumarate reductase cytochrome b subunit
MGIGGWFKFGGRSVFSWAFSFQRVTGIILLIYLCMHLAYLTSLTDTSGETYEKFISVTVTPTFLIFDILLVLCGVYHGINGLRIIIHEFGFAYEQRNALLAISIILIVAAWLYASYVMYSLVMGG